MQFAGACGSSGWLVVSPLLPLIKGGAADNILLFSSTGSSLPGVTSSGSFNEADPSYMSGLEEKFSELLVSVRLVDSTLTYVFDNLHMLEA